MNEGRRVAPESDECTRSINFLWRKALFFCCDTRWVNKYGVNFIAMFARSVFMNGWGISRMTFG